MLLPLMEFNSKIPFWKGTKCVQPPKNSQKKFTNNLFLFHILILLLTLNKIEDNNNNNTEEKRSCKISFCFGFNWIPLLCGKYATSSKFCNLIPKQSFLYTPQSSRKTRKETAFQKRKIVTRLSIITRTRGRNIDRNTGFDEKANPTVDASAPGHSLVYFSSERKIKRNQSCLCRPNS